MGAPGYLHIAPWGKINMHPFPHTSMGRVMALGDNVGATHTRGVGEGKDGYGAGTMQRPPGQSPTLGGILYHNPLPRPPLTL